MSALQADGVGAEPTFRSKFQGDIGIVVARNLAKVQAPFRLRYVAPNFVMAEQWAASPQST